MGNGYNLLWHFLYPVGQWCCGYYCVLLIAIVVIGWWYSRLTK